MTYILLEKLILEGDVFVNICLGVEDDVESVLELPPVNMVVINHLRSSKTPDEFSIRWRARGVDL